ncbi:N-acetylmuramic acid 6-phosphate etherase [Sphingobium algorifonticola]|uniref:N-acetylmuramic acid 6-phosphate etherase n=1 Tax=Sphingobium algorifonticola TaxID=2008318 RepID=A0A437J9Z2_9SPHN|nr:N-acetylmuramic acid 6-phosphate etherase [Sphingobium algorifonticola]RVT42318.1 N-acetylmuramic acid 6-phosphate etherase [Sphingobium algorifonticola]
MQKTESVNPRYVDIDSWPIEEAIDAMLEGQLAAVAAIKAQVAALAKAASAAAQHLRRGGRLVYVGAGTSGRIAVQDGVELGPTFGWSQDRLVFVLAGHLAALSVSAEGAEDDGGDARAQLEAAHIDANDVVIGVAASGRTPFTVSAVEWARSKGALTIGVANNIDAPLLRAAEFALLADTGSELIAGSTRMKAGTAQKVILNLLSTAIMLRLGRVYRGLMVDMVISNEKLLHRAHDMVVKLTHCDRDTAITAVRAANNDIKKAVLIAKGLTTAQATDVLERNNQLLRDAIAEIEA